MRSSMRSSQSFLSIAVAIARPVSYPIGNVFSDQACVTQWNALRTRIGPQFITALRTRNISGPSAGGYVIFLGLSLTRALINFSGLPLPHVIRSIHSGIFDPAV